MGTGAAPFQRLCRDNRLRLSKPSALGSQRRGKPRPYDDEEDYYVATVPALRGCHTQAKNQDTLMKRVREVIQLCLEDNQAAPSLELVGIQQISV